MTNRMFTSESVTEGHPDKVCDQISDAVLDSILAKDPMARVACETVCTTGLVFVMGEITTNCYVDIPKVVRQTVKEIGYNKPEYGFDANTAAVMTSIDEQSLDIAVGVNAAIEQRETGSADALDQVGAGDQGMMFGFACDETPELMPAPISFSHTLARQLAQVRKTGELPFIRPDGKTQVSVEYGETGEIVRIGAVVVSSQHDPEVSLETLREAIRESVIYKALPKELLDKETKIYVNPTGRFVTGGPVGDSGLTGRKIIVDTYGGHGGHGGGCFSGKDPTKVDRTGAYMARYVAKNLVAAGLAKRCQIELAYAIGVASPVSIYINTEGTGIVDDNKLVEIVQRNFDLRPAAMIEKLNLRRPIFLQTAAYGHFGRTDISLPWEQLDAVELLKESI